MQTGYVMLAKSDLAKYPFLKKTAEYVAPLNLLIEDLTSGDLQPILQRAEEKVTKAMSSVTITRDSRQPDIEILSYPVGLMIVAATKDSFIKKRYALSEAKEAFSDMQLENTEKIVAISSDFDWSLAPHKTLLGSMGFSLHFTDYLRNTSHLKGRKWRLINRSFETGQVYLNKHDVARLLQEEIQRRVEKRIETAEDVKYPTAILEVAKRIKLLSEKMKGVAEFKGCPKIIKQEAFPPCITNLYDGISSGRHLSHIGRFTLTSFLVSIGMSSEKVNNLFKEFSDYNERLTRYQIEHIAGERGSRTRYTPPKCATLQTHGICENRDDLCEKIYTPLFYYRKKHKRTK